MKVILVTLATAAFALPVDSCFDCIRSLVGLPPRNPAPIPAAVEVNDPARREDNVQAANRPAGGAGRHQFFEEAFDERERLNRLQNANVGRHQFFEDAFDERLKQLQAGRFNQGGTEFDDVLLDADQTTGYTDNEATTEDNLVGDHYGPLPRHYTED
jgi:hypothetical protein